MGYLNDTFTLISYFLVILYFATLGCIMLIQRDNPNSTMGEIEAKRRMTQSVGISMLIWAFDYTIYMPPLLLNKIDVSNTQYDVCYLITLMIVTPMLFVIMHAIVQKKVNTLLWTSLTAMPFLILTLWYSIATPEKCHKIPLHIATALNVASILYLIFRYTKEYRNYVRRIRSEYSETTDREIIWAWTSFSGFALQLIMFIIYEYNWTPIAEYIYLPLSMVNAAHLCYCTCRQKTLDINTVEDTDEDETEDDDQEGKAFYTIIEQKLDTLCKDNFLFLDPDLTREMLCRQLSINSTYLKLYFRRRNTSFYQYINTLRIEYAYKMMLENPLMPIRKICEQSGFRSQTTFRKMFQEVMNCLPSDVKRKKEE